LTRAQSSRPPEFVGDRLFRDVVAYSDLGERRTATEGDLKTADWLERELRQAGLKTERHPVHGAPVLSREITLVVDGVPVPCFPVWPVHATGPQPVRGPLLKVEPKSAIKCRRASLTAAESLNATVTSGSKSTTFVPWR